MTFFYFFIYNWLTSTYCSPSIKINKKLKKTCTVLRSVVKQHLMKPSNEAQPLGLFCRTLKRLWDLLKLRGDSG